VAFVISVNGAAVVIALSGWDRLMNWRRRIEFDLAMVEDVSVVDRSSLESMIDHRVRGCGTHNGSRRPGRRRIGTMLGRGVPGKQLWSVRAGPGSSRLIVLDLAGHDFRRAVLDVDDPTSFQSAVEQARRQT
jgi:hypothetical protein